MQLLLFVSVASMANAARSVDVAGGQFMQTVLQGDARHNLLGLRNVPKEEEETIVAKKEAVKPEETKEAKETKEVPEALFTAQTMPKVSPTVQCVINLSIQYFVIYTLLAFMRTFNQFTGNSLLGMQKILETSATTVTYAPMLAVLFLGIRMRAIQLTQGETEKYKLPQPWVQ